MKLLTSVVLASALAGCAFTPQQLSKWATDDLCRYIGDPLNPTESKRHAEIEVKSRGEQCYRTVAAVPAGSQATNYGDRWLAQQQQQIDRLNTPPSSVNCTTWGNGVNGTIRCQ